MVFVGEERARGALSTCGSSEKVVGAAATACSGDWSAWSCSASARLISWLRVEAMAGVNWDLVVGRRRVAPAEQW